MLAAITVTKLILSLLQPVLHVVAGSDVYKTQIWPLTLPWNFSPLLTLFSTLHQSQFHTCRPPPQSLPRPLPNPVAKSPP